MKFEWIVAFKATAESGSISAAARSLGLAKSVVSERLGDLERELGSQLIQRTTRKMSLTEDGALFLARARRIIGETEAAAEEIAERRGALRGALRISAPVSFGYLHLGKALYRFLERHPNIELTLDLDDRFINAAADGYDAVIRHGPVKDRSLTTERLGISRRVLVASPSYLENAGRPTSIANLTTHRGILYSNREADWRFRDGSGWTVVRPAQCLRVNNGLIMRGAALAGLGIALLPTFFVFEQLNAGLLTSLDLQADAEGAELSVCYPSSLAPSQKVLALIEWLRESFGDPPYWDASPGSGSIGQCQD